MLTLPSLAAVAALVLAAHPTVGDHLVPPTTGYGPDPYHAFAADKLLADRDAAVQLLVIPSLVPEWGVVVQRSTMKPTVVIARMAKTGGFWSAMNRWRREQPENAAGDDASALAAISVEVESSEAPLDVQTADALERLWRVALLDARYDDGDGTLGADGVTYTFGRWHFGLQRGEVWSPREGTRMRALADVGERLFGYARAPATEREAARKKLRDAVSKAGALLDRR